MRTHARKLVGGPWDGKTLRLKSTAWGFSLTVRVGDLVGRYYWPEHEPKGIWVSL